MARLQGRIKKIVIDRDSGERKGFGFIAADDGSEYFFHATGFAPSSARNFNELRENDRVEFAAGEGPKGPRAEDVVTVDA